MRRRPVLLMLVLWGLGIGALLIVPESSARVGGGHSYSGGSSRSGSSRGSSRSSSRHSSSHGKPLLKDHPWIALGLTLGMFGVAGAVLLSASRNENQRGGSFGSTGSFVQIRKPEEDRSMLAAKIVRLQQADPNFSLHSFLDFVQLLFVRVKEGIGRGSLESLSAFLSGEVLAALDPKGSSAIPKLTSVEEVIVGSTRIVGVKHLKNGQSKIEVDFEANYTAVWSEQGVERRQGYYAKERWTFSRQRDVLSKTPEAICALTCPSCGAAGEQTLQGQCRHCGQIVNTGKSHWVVQSTELLEKRDKAPIQTGGPGEGGVEPGTELPTVRDAMYDAKLKNLEAEDPDFSMQQLEQVARRCFTELQSAWTDLKWSRARAFETDHLFDTHRFWIERYRESGLNNRVEDVDVQSLDPAKVDQDAFYDAITMRIFASVLDFTVNQQGLVVEGSKTNKRTFSEYWTFIRRRKDQRRPVAEAKQPGKPSCPGCGAPIVLGQTGICEYCRAKVASGEFDWVVSLIEQDEAYFG